MSRILAFPIERYRLDHNAALSELELARAHYLSAMWWHRSDSDVFKNARARYETSLTLIEHVRRFGNIELPEVRLHGPE